MTLSTYLPIYIHIYVYIYTHTHTHILIILICPLSQSSVKALLRLYIHYLDKCSRCEINFTVHPQCISNLLHLWNAVSQICCIYLRNTITKCCGVQVNWRDSMCVLLRCQYLYSCTTTLLCQYKSTNTDANACAARASGSVEEMYQNARADWLTTMTCADS